MCRKLCFAGKLIVKKSLLSLNHYKKYHDGHWNIAYSALLPSISHFCVFLWMQCLKKKTVSSWDYSTLNWPVNVTLQESGHLWSIFSLTWYSWLAFSSGSCKTKDKIRVEILYTVIAKLQIPIRISKNTH